MKKVETRRFFLEQDLSALPPKQGGAGRRAVLFQLESGPSGRNTTAANPRELMGSRPCDRLLKGSRNRTLTRPLHHLAPPEIQGPSLALCPPFMSFSVTDPEELHRILDREVLPYVEEPAQYVNGEVNATDADFAEAEFRLALCFPDRYSLGMSHLGYQILYDIVNALPWGLAERSYAPWPDMQEAMRTHGIPLYTLESFQPVRDFDAVGFTLQSEILYTNVLLMLETGGISLHASERGEEDPVVIAGGPGASNPEPMAPFVDLFFIGDGEEIIVRFAELMREMKAGRASREEIIRRAAQSLPGTYAPSLYEPSYDENGLLNGMEPTDSELPFNIRAARVGDLDEAPFPTAPVVPFVETVHDRITLEIMRGCTRGCRFCHAGMTDRPRRHRSPETLFGQAVESYENTGHNEIALASLSSSDYPHMEELLERLTAYFDPLSVSISLPSLRVSEKLKDLVGPLSSVRKSGLTLAPEAASERLRNVINKGITTEKLREGVRSAAQEGWRHAKLYFMIGLPTETEDDVMAIGELCQQVRQEASAASSNSSLRLNVTISPFIPKPHTPFQWEPVTSADKLEEKRRLILDTGSNRSIRYKFHDPRRSMVEAVLARGDRRVSEAILNAYERGARFDAWDEHFEFERWESAFREIGITMSAEGERTDLSANSPFRRRSGDEHLPWDHIDCGVRKGFLLKERKRARNGQRTPDCHGGVCGQCGACSPGERPENG